ncbi:hypothetical protein [Desulfonatronospira sp.]|uniref:hypothetical protein n=1 Tax=Desulfonatronospira sp. TaxID=1962951 RepID=UPI0025BAB80C|nr:hypothetical protein [Desulfonatronospira sp.]
MTMLRRGVVLHPEKHLSQGVQRAVCGFETQSQRGADYQHAPRSVSTGQVFGQPG